MKTVLLIGLGHFGKHIARELNRLGHQVMAVDRNETRVNDILPLVTNAQIGDSTNPEFLRSLGVGNYDLCIVSIGDDFQNSLETTSLLKDWGQSLLFPEQTVMCRKNSCFVTVPMRLYTRKSRWQSGLQSDLPRGISVIILSWMIPMPFLRLMFPKAGWGRVFRLLTYGENIISILWPSKRMAGFAVRCFPIPASPKT